MKHLPLLLASTFFGLLPSTTSAEVLLLTGDSNNAVHNSSAKVADISADGDLVLLITGPPVTGSTPGITQGGLYIRQLSADTLTYVAGDTGSYIGVGEAALSDNGRYVAWRSTDNSVSGVTNHANHIYWRDRTADVTRLLTADSESVCVNPKISADGRYVTFVSAARNLPVAPATLPTTVGRLAIYLYDSQDESLEIVSLAPNGSALVGVGSNALLECYDFSADGKFIVYSTESANAHPDRSSMLASWPCICRRDLTNGTVTLLNRDSSGNVVNGNFTTPRTNATGSRTIFAGGFIGFLSPTNKMVASVPGNLGSDLYVKDSDTGEVWWASKTTTGDAHTGSFSGQPAINGAGDVVAFTSSSTILTAENSDAGGGSTGSFDVFRADLGSSGAATLTLITKSPTGSGNVVDLNGPVVPGTGDYVAFNTNQVEAMIGSPSTFSQGIGVGTFPTGTPAGLSYEDWSAALPLADRDFTDIPAGDGVENLTKYIMGMDPTMPDLSHLPVPGTSPGTDLGLPADPETYLTLQVRIRRELAVGFTWTVRTANDLANLAAGAGTAVQVGSPTPDGDFDLYLFRFPTPTSAVPGTGFMDVSLSAP